MEKNKYNYLVNKYTPKENRLTNGVISFLIGGSMGVVGELLRRLWSNILDIPLKDTGTYMIITLIFIGCLFTALGFFDNIVNFAKAGLIVPITGFAHSMQSAALEYRNEGLVTGLGANIFKLSGTVILYGVVSAYVFGLIRLLLFGG